jgi:hypothetical protein
MLQLGRLSIKSQVSSLSTNSSIVENEIAEVEMLLEAYFMHFDNTFNRLQVCPGLTGMQRSSIARPTPAAWLFCSLCAYQHIHERYCPPPCISHSLIRFCDVLSRP